MQPTTLARYGAPIAIVAGALMIITRPVILFTTPTEIDDLRVGDQLFICLHEEMSDGIESFAADGAAPSAEGFVANFR